MYPSRIATDTEIDELSRQLPSLVTDWWILSPEEEQEALAIVRELEAQMMSQRSTRTRYQEIARPDRGRPKKKSKR